MALIVIGFLLYNLVRGLAVERVPEATSRGIRLLELEQNLGLFWEVEMQAWIMSSRLLVELSNGIYLYGHFPLIIIIGLWLFFFHRRRYILFRNAFLISGAIGLIIFNLLPTAPPRLLPWTYGLIDTQLAYSPINYEMQPAAFVNRYAAMPSLHAGWNLLLGIALIWTSRNVILRGFGVVMPSAMALAVVTTGNHFILDVVAGVVVALIGLAVAMILERHGGSIWRRLMERRRRAAEGCG